MAFVVVDTDVVSFWFKGDSRVQFYRPHLNGNTLVLSFMTVAEFRYWSLVRNWGEPRRHRMELLLDKFVRQPWDDALCTAWAEVTHHAMKKGRTLNCADAWIAATAYLHDVPLVTHNATDFQCLEMLTVIAAQ